MPEPLHPVFSIITVTYNAEDVIERTIKSVIGQTYQNIEYIIVDGASNDSTLSIARHYQHYIHHLISEPDSGLYDAMNKGIGCATGDYFCFLNAGDTFKDENTLIQMLASLPEDSMINGQQSALPDILYGNTAIVDENGQFLHMRRLVPPKQLTWKSFKNGMLVCHQAFFVRRCLAEPYDLQYRFSADFDWCIRMMKKAHSIYNTNLTLINYLEGGLTKQNHKASLKERFRIMVKYYGWFSTVVHHVWFVIRAVLKPEK